MMQFPENLPEDLLELVERRVGDVLFVESLVRKVEFFPEGLAIEGGFVVGGKHPVGGFENGGQIVDESARPIEDKVADQKKGLRGYGIKEVYWCESEKVKSEQKVGVSHFNQEW